MKCDIDGCNQDAVVVDEFDNFLCSDCMESEIQDEGTDYADYANIA